MPQGDSTSKLEEGLENKSEETLEPTTELTPEQVVELVVNLDDVSAELIGEAQTQLLEAGALDVWTTSIHMKKQRPGVMLSLLAASSDQQRMTRLLLQLTGSFGVRYRAWDRVILQRDHVTVLVREQEVRLKVGWLKAGWFEGDQSADGSGVDDLVIQPEYEDVRALSASVGVTFRVVYAEAVAVGQVWKHEHASAWLQQKQTADTGQDTRQAMGGGA